jgi:hypothetical protein
MSYIAPRKPKPWVAAITLPPVSKCQIGLFPYSLDDVFEKIKTPWNRRRLVRWTRPRVSPDIQEEEGTVKTMNKPLGRKRRLQALLLA